VLAPCPFARAHSRTNLLPLTSAARGSKGVPPTLLWPLPLLLLLWLPPPLRWSLLRLPLRRRPLPWFRRPLPWLRHRPLWPLRSRRLLPLPRPRPWPRCPPLWFRLQCPPRPLLRRPHPPLSPLRRPLLLSLRWLRPPLSRVAGLVAAFRLVHSPRPRPLPPPSLLLPLRALPIRPLLPP
jgi:hypothetical protein